MFNARRFTKEGFIRREDLDFYDDGSSFKGYEYNGMPITYIQHKEQKHYFSEEKQQWIWLDEYEYKCYISVRVDYVMRENDYTFDYFDMRDKDWHIDCDKFNGCNADDVDLDELKVIINNAWVGMEKLEEAVNNEEIEADKMQLALNNEIAEAMAFLDNFKDNFDCFDRSLDSYAIKRYIEYANRLDDAIKNGLTMDFKTMDFKQYRFKRHCLEEYGYVLINMKNDFCVKEMSEYLENKKCEKCA